MKTTYLVIAGNLILVITFIVIIFRSRKELRPVKEKIREIESQKS